jgi:hypothetical protein
MAFERALAFLLSLAITGCTVKPVTNSGAEMGSGPPDAGANDTPDFSDVPPGSDLARDPNADLAIPPGSDLSGTPLTPVSVLTQHNDQLRTGGNTRETVLNTTNVNPSTFGKLFTREVDGFVYAQPLVVGDLTIAGKKRNVLFVATEHNSVFAFDADDPVASAPLWQVNMGTPVPTSEYTCLDQTPEDGITSTPVIDATTNTIYVSAKHKDNGVYAQTLHALDLATGAEKFGGPVDISGSVPGNGWGTKDDVTVPFNAQLHFQRPALLLANGQIYLAFGSHCDRGAYHGWMFAYDAKTLQRTAAWATTPNGGMGSIWMSGAGPAADPDGNVYLISANGDVSLDGSQLSEAFVKLSPTLQTKDWFIPYNYEWLNQEDFDLGSDGPLLIPNSNLLISSGKEGVLYVLDRNNMGKFKAGDNSQILQSFKISHANVHGTPVYWQGPTERYIYVWPEETQLLRFRLANGVLDPTPSTSTRYAPGGMPGGILSLSSDGSRAGSAILWATMPLAKNAIHETVEGVVFAHDATDLSKELWSSEMNPSRDRVGMFAKFNAPTVANGKVYVGTFSNQIVVYGLIP